MELSWPIHGTSFKESPFTLNAIVRYQTQC